MPVPARLIVTDLPRVVERRDTASVPSTEVGKSPENDRWSVEQVEALAPTPAAVSAARPLATPTRWSGTGADHRAVWGACRGSGAEPYEVVVDHVGVATRCTCPSRRVPCKHALALLLMWSNGQIPEVPAPSSVDAWIDARRQRADAASARSDPSSSASEDAEPSPSDAAAGRSGAADPDEPHEPDSPPDLPEPPETPDRTRERDERVARMHAGLDELDRWLDDRIRTGLADPSLARYATWDQLAARLVDARAGSLANRIRRLAGEVGARPDWHDSVLAELGLLHLLARSGRRLADLPPDLADVVATTVGWQVKQADVLAGVPETDDWIVAGRTDAREDRIEVRRHWLLGRETGRWALVLSFAAYQQSLDTSLTVGTSIRADLHRYPGAALRCLVGRRHDEPAVAAPPTGTVAEMCEAVGSRLAVTPWLDRIATTVRAAPAQHHDRWLLTDVTGSVPLLVDRADGAHADSLDTVLAVSAGHPVDLTVEWTPRGVVAVAVHTSIGSIDLGLRADDSFVSAA